MKCLKGILGILAVLLVVGSVDAQTVNWTFVEGGWITFDPDNASRENGWFVGGSGALRKVPIHIFGEWADLDVVNIWQAGAGWHGLLGKRADLFADGAFYDADVEDGFKIRFGVRWMLTQRLELNGNLAWTDLDFTDNESFAANAIWSLSKRFAIGGGIEWGDHWTFGDVFVRFNFGPQS